MQGGEPNHIQALHADADFVNTYLSEMRKRESLMAYLLWAGRLQMQREASHQAIALRGTAEEGRQCCSPGMYLGLPET